MSGMLTCKEKLVKLLNELSESELEKVLEFTENLHDKQYGYPNHAWMNTKETSIEFWDHAIDEEIWNKM